VKRASAGPFDDTFPRSKSSHFRRRRLTGYDARSRYHAKSCYDAMSRASGGAMRRRR
jgi:hypothetical protein